MKVYSDTLTTAELIEAAHDVPHVYVEAAPMERPRIRSRGWNVRLSSVVSKRHRNSGTIGAATWQSPAASWDEHGAWMARVFELDPGARVAFYDGRDDFHSTTHNQYRVSA